MISDDVPRPFGSDTQPTVWGNVPFDSILVLGDCQDSNIATFVVPKEDLVSGHVSTRPALGCFAEAVRESTQ